MDLSSPSALAHIPILVVPIGSVRRSTWTTYLEHITSFGSIPQLDVPLPTSLSRSRFFPSLASSLGPSNRANTGNEVHLKFLVSPPATGMDSSTESLTVLRPSAQVLAIIGIVDLGETLSLDVAGRLLRDRVEQLFPEGAGEGCPLVTRCFGVEGVDREVQIDIRGAEAGAGGSGGENAVVVIPKMADPRPLIGAMLGDMLGTLLSEFSEIASVLETPSGLAFLTQSQLPPLSILPRGSSSFPHAQASSSAGLTNQARMSITSPPSRTSSPALGHQPHPSLPHGASTGALPSSSGDVSNAPSLPRSNTSSSLRTLSLAPAASSMDPAALPVRTGFGGPGRRRIVSGASGPSSGFSTPGGGVAAGATAAAQARLAAVMGSLHLLSGRLGDAVVSFNDAIAAFIKLPIEAIWHASSLEGLATALLLIESKPKPWSPTAPPVLQDIQNHLNQALALYHKASPPLPSTSASSRDPLAFLYTSVALRHARLISEIYISGEISPLSSQLSLSSPRSLKQRDFPPPPRPTPTASATQPGLIRLGLTRSDVVRLAGKAHGPWLSLLADRERIAALSKLVDLMRGLGMRRREGIYARQVLGCVVDLVVRARVTASSSAVVGQMNGAASTRGEVGVRAPLERDGNEGLMVVLARVLEGYGVDLDRELFVQGLETKNLGAVEIAGGGGEPVAGSGGKTAMESGVNARFGWPELQLRALRDGIAIAEALPDHPTIVLLALTALRTLHPFLPPSEQAHLASIFPRALATSRRRGELPADENSRLKFWAGWLVLSLEAGTPLPSHVPIEHGMQDRTAPSSLTAVGLVRDPFLYNPRSKASQLNQPIFIQGETLEFFVTLQNPLSFDLEISNLRLSTSGVDFICHPCSVLLPPLAFHTVRVTGTASNPGTLLVRGCVIRLTDGSEAEFILPVLDAEEERRQRKRESIREGYERSLKLSGLDARPSERRKRESARLEGVAAAASAESGDGGPSSKIKKAEHPPKRSSSGVVAIKEPGFLRCEVVPEQPLLRLRGTSLTHGAMMLYDGEESNIRITLENISHLPIDFVKLSFQDSTLEPAQALIAEGELSPGDAHEVESDLVDRPVFRWDQAGQPILIAPGAKHSLNVRTLGKVGCTHGSILIDYAYLDRPGMVQRPTLFHTRQIIFPVLLTVYHTLECTSMDILRLPSSGSAGRDMLPRHTKEEEVEDLSLSSLLRKKDADEEYCLLAVDVRNVYGQSFEVSFQRENDREGGALSTSKRLISPGSTERIVLPIPRVLLPASKSTSPIPTLTERQFVVSKLAASKAEEDLTRTLFWYREELLRLVTATWKEPEGSRRGRISLRSSRLSAPMLDVLRSDELAVSLAASPQPAGAPVVPNEFFELVVSLRNRMSRSIHPLVHLSPVYLTQGSPSTWASPPSSSDPSPRGGPPALAAPPRQPDGSSTAPFVPSHFIHDGLLSTTPPTQRVLGPGETVEVVFRVAVLAEGRAQFRAAVEELVELASLDTGGGGGGREKRRRQRAEAEAKAQGKKALKADQFETVERAVWFSDVLGLDVRGSSSSS